MLIASCGALERQIVNTQEIRRFAYALADADDAPGPSLVVRVKYRSSPSVYDEGAPWGRSKVEEGRIEDPGFGSGPVAFDDIEWVSVSRVPTRPVNVPGHIRKFESLVALCSGIEGVLITADSVTLNLD
jgi:hypothetical protein